MLINSVMLSMKPMKLMTLNSINPRVIKKDLNLQFPRQEEVVEEYRIRQVMRNKTTKVEKLKT